MKRLRGVTDRRIAGENMKHLGNEQFRLTKMEAQLWVMAGVQAREKLTMKNCLLSATQSELYP